VTPLDRHRAGPTGRVFDLVNAYDEAVTNDAAGVLREALSLSQRDRADLVAELLASFDEAAVDAPEVVEALWSEELARRAARAVSGQAPGEDWAAVRQRLASELSE
jgi:hypothetical protein